MPTDTPQVVALADKYEARPVPEKPWVWQVWDVTHEAECNHFPIATFDSNGAADDFNERDARLFLTAITALRNRAPDKVGEVTVTQADRDAAAVIARSGAPGLGNGNKVIGDEIKGGLHDSYLLVQAFARHRTTSTSALAEDVAALAEQYELDIAAEAAARHRTPDEVGEAEVERLAEEFCLAGFSDRTQPILRAEDPSYWSKVNPEVQESYRRGVRAILARTTTLQAAATASDSELVAENARLREALRPFGRHVGKLDAPVSLTIGKDTWTDSLTSADFWRARALLHREGTGQ